VELDRVQAEKSGRIPRSITGQTNNTPLPVQRGRELYENHIGRPRVTGGVRPSTKKKYRAVFNKLLPFLADQGVTTWNAVTTEVVNRYAAYLEKEGFAAKSIRNELTTIKQTVRWLTEAEYLIGAPPIKVKLRQVESQPAYCYREVEVAAIISWCRQKPKLNWLADVVTALACTGLRISELVSLRWSDINLENDVLRIIDESGFAGDTSDPRRHTKSGRSRTLNIHPALQKVFQSIPRKGSYIFQGPRGGRLKADTVRQILVREVIKPLSPRFPSVDGDRGFADGRLHSFRHYFCSFCANNKTPEKVVMEWLGHANSDMIRNYYHLHDEVAKQWMNNLDFIGATGGRSVGTVDDNTNGEGDHPAKPEGEKRP